MFNLKTGIDILDIHDFQQKSLDSQNIILNQTLYPEELSDKLESNLGKVAAKEAIMKTGLIQPGEWKKIKIINSPQGQPQVYDEKDQQIPHISISISHVTHTVVAFAIYEPKNN